MNNRYTATHQVIKYTYICKVFLLTMFLFCVHNVVHAQLSSTNYQIDTYSIGEATAQTGTSTNYTAVFGVQNYEYDAPAAETGGGGRGTVLGGEDEDESVATSSSDGEGELSTPVSGGDETPETVPYNPAEAYQVPVAPYTGPQPVGFVQPADAFIDISEEDVIAYTPTHSSSEISSTEDTSAVTFYKAVGDGIEVQVTIPNNTFSYPDGYDDALGPYQIYVVITEEELQTEQMPLSEYNVTLLGGYVFNINIIDSLERVLKSTRNPIQVRFTVEDTLDYSINTQGYFFNSAISGWVGVSTLRTENNSIEFEITKPALFGLWGGEVLPQVLSIEQFKDDVVSEETALYTEEVVDTQNSCTFVWIIPCQFWWIVPAGAGALSLLIIYLVYRRFR